MRRPLTQVIARSALAILAILVVALIALHTSPVQSRLLGWSADFLRRTAQIDLAAGQVRLNLFTRRLELTKLRVAAVGHTDNPFFVAEQVSVALPWAAYRGVLAIEDIRLVAGRITITLDADGQSNLPPGGEPADPDAPPFRLDIRNAGIEGLDFEYRDAQGQIAVQMPGIHLSLAYAPEQAAAVGVLAIEQPLEVLVGDREIRVDPVRAGLAFDGSGLRLADLGLRTSEGTFTVSGAIQRALDQPTLDLAITGTADLARAAAWADPPMHVAGEARVTATMKGPPDALAIDAQVRSENLELGRERAMRADVQAAMTPSRLVLPRARLSLTSGAEMRATLDMPLSPDAPLRAEAEWKGLDAPTILRLADQDQRPLGAVSGGTARLERSAAGALTIRLRNTISPRSGPGLVPVAGDLDFSVTGDRWRLTQRHELGGTRVEGTAGGRWETTDVTRSTLDGALTVASDVENALAQAGRLGVEVPTALQNTSGQLDAALTLSGTLGEPRIAGTVNSAGLEIPSVGRVALSATLDASPRLVRANDIDLSLGSTTIRGEVGANLLTRRIDGALTLNAPSAGALLATLVPDTQIDGSVTARATLGGTLDAPDIRAELTGSDLTVAEQVFESLSVRARVLDDGVTIESLGIKQGAGALTATGRYSWNGRYTIDVESQGLTWRGPIAQLGDAEVKFGATFSGSGSLARPVGSGTITFDVGGGLAGDLIRQGTATLRLDGDTARVVGNVPSLGALLTATISPQSPFTYDAVLVVNQLDLAKLAPLAGIAGESLSGAASLSVLAKGALSAPADSTAFVNLQEAKAAVAGVPIALAAPSRLAWDGQALTVDGLEASVGRGRLVATGRLDTGGLSSAQWKTAFDGELEDLVALGRPFGVPAALIAAGPIGLTWHTTGGLDRSTATLVLSGSTVSWEALPSVTDLGLDARFDGSTVTVTRLTGQWQDGKIQGTARVPLAALTSGEDDPALPPDKAGVATIQIAGLSQAALAPWVSPVVLSGIAGRLGATVEARIQRPSVDGVTATLTLDEAAFTLAGVDVAQSRRSQVTFAGGLITATDVAFNAGGSPLTVTGTVRVAPEDQQQLDLTVQGIADLRILSAFAPTVATDGEARFNMGIGGPMSAPVLSGRIDLSGAEAAIREPRLVISDVSGTIALDGSRVVFDRLNGNANGGRVVLDGSFLLDGFTPVEGGLSAVLEQIALDYPMGLQSETTALVTIRPGPSGWSLTGDVRIERSVFNETLSLAAIVAGGGASAPSVAGEESPAEQLRLNLFVSTQQDLLIDNNYGRLEAGTAMRVAGTAANPVLSGRITLREGSEVFLAGNRFRVSRGTISFINPNRIDPEFDIELTTRVSGSEITLTLEGTVERLETEVRSSDPMVDSREAMALLFGGTQADAAALLSAELLGVTGRAVGLDTLRLE
ncbi:MAG: translocation/assembly module TamB domain-containing protein, partial [Acidobacteriota bacterium]